MCLPNFRMRRYLTPFIPQYLLPKASYTTAKSYLLFLHPGGLRQRGVNVALGSIISLGLDRGGLCRCCHIAVHAIFRPRTLGQTLTPLLQTIFVEHRVDVVASHRVKQAELGPSSSCCTVELSPRDESKPPSFPFNRLSGTAIPWLHKSPLCQRLTDWRTSRLGPDYHLRSWSRAERAWAVETICANSGSGRRPY